MKLKIVALAAITFLINGFVSAAPEIGKSAPDFTLTDSTGKPVKLSQYQGSFVVLEWLNHGCPFVRKHYDSENMQKLQKTYTGKGVIWLSIVSSAPGKEGYVTGPEAEKERAENNSKATAILLDPAGTVGKLYGAKTTPHLFVINKTGQLVYMGAIDDRPTVDMADVPSSKNYVKAALDNALDGKAIKETSTKPYGCSVKYSK